jgi:oligopeptide transport system ATP-binding protein
VSAVSAFDCVLEARGLCKTYVQGKLWQKKRRYLALENVSLAIRPATTVALVGESGCGKTTLAKCLVGLETLDGGEVLLAGRRIELQDRRALRAARKEIQLIFQDSASALNPRMSAIEIVEEPLLIRASHSRLERRVLAEEMLENVGISQRWKDRKPQEFSGGQRQRIAIARALTVEPRVLILDEIFAELDISIKGEIANLLLGLQQSRGLSYLCISHDLSIATQIADEVAVMDRGRIVRQGSPQEVFTSGSSIGPQLQEFPQLERSACVAHSGT